MLDTQAHAQVVGKQVRQRLPWSGRAGAAGSAAFEGSQAKRGGDVPEVLPLERKRSAQALKGRRRQGSKPDGRDSARSAGRSPRARWRYAGTLTSGGILQNGYLRAHTL
ncbi:hypothetical protein DOT67_03890 [Ralstonia pseudosolanacearum]|uniref:Uncharacterized protein n=1 Tax=Ralstonia pseudosolanacearum TaxID=1310165 RepID=A0A454TZC0_9RALS|nr:hypothetical protein DOT67_03890 [Ralstonia pseudosolanacearum]RNM11267.1 hypothetical protein EGA29_00280 [Ralstonia pseudosolanacearum]